MNLLDRLNPEELKDFQSLVTDEGKRIFLQELLKRDFRAFVYLLGYRDLGKFHEREIESLGRVRFLESRAVRRLWFWSRGFFKTSLITEAHTLWLIVNNPNIRILIVSFSLEVAKKPLGAIRNHITSNNDFRYFFKEFCPKENKEGKVEFGTSEQFTVPNRTQAKKEPTCMCAGVGTNITGLHFDYMKIDDLVNKDSVTNDTQITSSKDYYSLLRPIYDNPTIPREDVVGTIYHFNDLHSDLLKNGEFEKSVIPAHIDGEFIFPERLNEEGWNSLLNDPTLSPYSIQSQWMLRPQDPTKSVFKEEWIKYYDQVPEKLAEYICVDPASTQKKKSDYTVLTRWGIDSEGRHYLLEGVRDKLTSFQRIDKLFGMVKNSKNLKWVKYEVLGGRHGDLEVIAQKQRQEQVFFYLKETKSTTSSKTDRVIQRLQGPYSAGAILWPRSLIFRSEHDGKTYDFTQLIKLEFLQFPFTEHDDIIDCQSQMFEEENIKGEKTKEVRKVTKLTADEEERQYKGMLKIRRANPYLTDSQFRGKMFKNRVRKIIARI